MEAIVEAKKLKKYFQVERGFFRKKAGCIRAVDGVTLFIRKGEILGLVGESGCGKTTAGKLLLNLIRPDEGSVTIDGIEIDKDRSRSFKKKAQVIFQDPYGSLSPRMKIKEIISEGIDIFKLYSSKPREKRLDELLRVVGLSEIAKDKYPHQFSGGERQRIGIARALSTEPDFIVCDEPVSSLDVSIRAQILNLLQDLQKKFSLSYLFISHDLNVVRFISDRIAVMYKGKIVEEAETEELYNNPLHPYTRYLLSANLTAESEQRHKRFSLQLKEKEAAEEEQQQEEEQRACSFYPICPLARSDCRKTQPPLKEVKSGHQAACHLYS
jgi:oligopeptide transport system ATP-binding protein